MFSDLPKKILTVCFIPMYKQCGDSPYTSSGKALSFTKDDNAKGHFHRRALGWSHSKVVAPSPRPGERLSASDSKRTSVKAEAD